MDEKLLSDGEIYRKILAHQVLFIEEERITVNVVPLEGTGKTVVEILVDGKDPEGELLERLREHAKHYGAVEAAKA